MRNSAVLVDTTGAFESVRALHLGDGSWSQWKQMDCAELDVRLGLLWKE